MRESRVNLFNFLLFIIVSSDLSDFPNPRNLKTLNAKVNHQSSVLFPK